MTVDSWVEHPTLPKITCLSPTVPPRACSGGHVGGPIAGGTTFSIIGTGFVSGSTTVQFVEEAGGSPTTDNEVLTASGVPVVSPTSITATAPPVTEGSTYFVTVTTPAGTSTSADGANVFTYTRMQLPTVTSVCTGPVGTKPTVTPARTTSCNLNSTSQNASGPISGGSEVTIWGTNFLRCLTCTPKLPIVKFVSASGSSTSSAPYVTVVSNDEITATTPTDYKVAPNVEFYVTVTTPGGTSSKIVAFDYLGMVPTVESVRYLTTHAKVTITGTGFVTGAAVKFVKDSATGPTGASISSASVTVISGATITASVPNSLHAGTKYFVTVTSPQGTSSYYPTFTYV